MSTTARWKITRIGAFEMRIPDITPEEIEWLEEQLKLLEFIFADRNMKLETILKQPEHVPGFIRIGYN